MPTSHPLLLFLLFIFYRDREKLSGREVERAMHIDLQNCSRRDQRPESLCTVLYTLYQMHHILAPVFFNCHQNPGVPISHCFLFC